LPRAAKIDSEDEMDEDPEMEEATSGDGDVKVSGMDNDHSE